MQRLEADTVREMLADLPAWTFSEERGGRIAREVTFADFDEAFGFMTRVALLASRRDHHPEWSNVYNHVAITLTTHDAGGVSTRDIDMARLIDRALGEVPGS